MEMPSRILLPYPSATRPFPQFSWSHRRDKGQRQTDRHQGRFPESRNDLEEPDEGEMASVNSNQRGALTITADPRT
jgi:hypothetical protein